MSVKKGHLLTLHPEKKEKAPQCSEIPEELLTRRVFRPWDASNANIMMMSQLSKKPPRATSKTRRGSCFGSRVPTVKRSLYPVIGSSNIPTRIRPSKKPPRLPEEAFPTDVSIFPLAQLTQWPRTFKIAPKLHLRETKWFHGLHE